MKVLSKKAKLADHGTETLVVFVANGGDKISLPSQLDKELAQQLNNWAKDKFIRGDHKEAVFFRDLNRYGARHLLLVGLGSTKNLNLESARQATAVAHNQLKSQKCTNAAFWLDSLARCGKNAGEVAHAATEGVLLASYKFDELKSASAKAKKEKEAKELESILLFGSSAGSAIEKNIEAATTLSDCINMARRLGDMPGNLMTPEILANEAVKAAKGTNLKVTVWDRARIQKEKMGGLLGVSLGSDKEPRFIIMEYRGAGAGKKPVAFVGKGLTFDSGGISIKPSQSMEEMKYDMCGGAAVIATLLAVAKLKLKVNVMGFVSATENMPGPGANKPGDVLTARNGKTFEVNNTDAEGRLILADALAYASEQSPAAIFDAATLTGAIVVALGNTHTGVFTRDQKLWQKIHMASTKSGEWLWQMPLTDFHAEDIKGTYADISNISNFKGAGSATAAAFLEHFVEKGIPWAHFDIAGTAWATGNRLPYTTNKGASGVMIRTFVELAKMF